MCRFALYLGAPITMDALATEPEHSILMQSLHAREREDPLSGDGFGVGWYAPAISPEPALYRSPLPAWNDPNLRQLARVTRSGCILAHVRAASPGSAVSVVNCHPFASGPFAFMHNGSIAGFAALRRRLLAGLSEEAFRGIGGTTDSEYAFALFLDLWRGARDTDPAERMASALTEAIAKIEWVADDAGVEEASYLNFAVTDGHHAVVARYATPPRMPASLWLCHGRRYSCERGVCRMLPSGPEGGATLVCSEPLSEDADWQKVPAQHMVVVSGHRADLRPIPFNVLTRTFAA